MSGLLAFDSFGNTCTQYVLATVILLQARFPEQQNMNKSEFKTDRFCNKKNERTKIEEEMFSDSQGQKLVFMIQHSPSPHTSTFADTAVSNADTNTNTDLYNFSHTSTFADTAVSNKNTISQFLIFTDTAVSNLQFVVSERHQLAVAGD